MTSEWAGVIIPFFFEFIGSLIAYIRAMNKIDILQSEIKQKDDLIHVLREDKRILWDRVQKTK